MERDIDCDMSLLALLCNDSTGGTKGASSFTSTATSAAPSATTPTSASFSSVRVLLCVWLPYPPSSTETTRPEQQRSAMRIISVVIHSKSEGLKSMPFHTYTCTYTHVHTHMHVHT
jgi:hypothetical protein